jgi:hypothetical protein
VEFGAGGEPPQLAARTPVPDWLTDEAPIDVAGARAGVATFDNDRMVRNQFV